MATEIPSPLRGDHRSRCEQKICLDTHDEKHSVNTIINLLIYYVYVYIIIYVETVYHIYI